MVKQIVSNPSAISFTIFSNPPNIIPKEDTTKIVLDAGHLNSKQFEVRKILNKEERFC